MINFNITVFLFILKIIKVEDKSDKAWYAMKVIKKEVIIKKG